MLSIKNHPFGVKTFFNSSLVITYAAPKEELQRFIPPCLELDTFKDQWAFVAVALVDVKKLRPSALPAFLGNDFVLAGYRIFTRFTNHQNKRRRGLFILKSETNKKKMSLFGNLFTHYQYTTTDISMIRQNEGIKVSSLQSGISIKVSIPENDPALPPLSPFSNWAEARRFAGPLPFTFTVLGKQERVLVIEGVRQNWTPKPVAIDDCKIDFISQLGVQNIHPASAFIVENIPYRWKKGKLEKWNV